MAGSLSLSLSQQFDELGRPLNGGLLYTYQAGTTSPQSAYQDVALTLPYPNPITLDSAGRIPAFYLADGQIKIRLTNAGGVTQVAADNLLVIGASSGSGSPPSVDATTILQTGALMPFYGTGTRTGFVRANGRTIGSASSGASERGNSDCQDLFEYLWTADANLTVSTGRGGSANDDWIANKTIALPDWRGRTLAFLDDMGASASGRLTATYFGTAATALGAAGGLESNNVILTHKHINTITDPGHYHTVDVGSSGGGTDQVTQGVNSPGATVTGPVNANTTGITITNVDAGSASAHNIVQPTMLATLYIKI